MNQLTGTDGCHDTIRARLQRIADALGHSIAAFETRQEPGLPDETAELLHLWAQIDDPAGRRQALAVIRSLAEAEER